MVLSVRPGGSGAAKDLRIARQPIQFNPVDSALCGSSGESPKPKSNRQCCNFLQVLQLPAACLWYSTITWVELV